ncbi:MAG: TonB-dependent receptor [Acidobacteria bacterium]|nr:TonB-dependent receptor [Acidobacteriota bacterium]
MHVRSSLLAAIALAAAPLFAQTTKPAAGIRDSITVLATAEPVTEGESSRSVETIDTASHPALVSGPATWLRSDPSVDIQMRGPMGVQSDISIRGTSFEQTLVLLNGLRINDAQTSHFNLDVPVPLLGISSIDVLHGAGSTLYGSDAVGGVVDLRTSKPDVSSLRLRAGVGSYGINQQGLAAALAKRQMSEMLTGSRDFSTGFIADRDYRSENAASETRLNTFLGDTDLLLATSDRAYGADQFYGNYPSWERTKAWFAAGTQNFGQNTSASLAYRRHSDVFVLFRNNPAAYENNHIDTSWQGVVRRKDTIGSRISIFSGLEENADTVNSNNLGRHGRNRGAGYVDVDFRSKFYSLSVGVRNELIGGYGNVASPSVSGAAFLTENVKVRGAVGYGFRLPTYTDLYYKDPTTNPNPALQPESAWNYEGGFDWYATPHLAFSATGFTSHQHDAIDYVRSGNAGPYQAQNLSAFQFTGAELSLRAQLAHRQQLRLAYTGVTGAQDALAGIQSRYLFNYPSNNASAEWIAPLRNFTLRTRLGVTQRFQRDPYATVDLSVAREKGIIRPYLQMTNLSNTGYEEIKGVRMQGRAFVGGVDIVLSRRRRY